MLEMGKFISIKKKTFFSSFVLLIILFAFLVSLLYCFNAYDKPMEYYSGKYMDLSEVTVAVDAFNGKAYKYSINGGEYNFNEMMEYLSWLQTSFNDLYSTRYEYDNANREKIDDMKACLSTISLKAAKMTSFRDTSELSEIYNKEVAIEVISFKEIHYEVIDELTGCANSRYEKSSSAVFFVKIITTLILVFGTIVVVCYIVFVHKRVAKPITEINDWAKLFKEDYADMSNLTYDKNDEIKQLCESFNIVKERLIQANNYKKEYEQAVVKLHDEENHKKTFVQKLYVEKKERESITSEARHDGLTGLFNRRTFDKLVNEFFEKKADNQEGVLFLIDMDDFKNVNDILGHIAGDEALKILAGAMRTVFPEEYLGRYGGDEFTVFIAVKPSYVDISTKAEALRKIMDRKLEFDSKSVNLSVSIGIAGTDGTHDYSELYMKSDKALYTSKENGRNTYTIADEDWRI